MKERTSSEDGHNQRNAAIRGRTLSQEIRSSSYYVPTVHAYMYMYVTVCLLVGCFGLKGPLRNISVSIGPSPREREKEKRNDGREKNCPITPTSTHRERSS